MTALFSLHATHGRETKFDLSAQDSGYGPYDLFRANVEGVGADLYLSPEQTRALAELFAAHVGAELRYVEPSAQQLLAAQEPAQAA